MTTDLATLLPEAANADQLMQLAYATDAPTVAALVKNRPLADKAHALARYKQEVRALALTDAALDKVALMLAEEEDLAKATNAMDKLSRLRRAVPENQVAGSGIAFRIILPDGHQVSCEGVSARRQAGGHTDDAPPPPPVSVEVTLPPAKTNTWQPSPLVIDGEFDMALHSADRREGEGRDI